MTLALVSAPPVIHAVDSEQAIIGAALFDPANCSEAFDRIRPEHFYDPVMGMIWSKIVSYVHKSLAPDLVAISEELRGNPGFQELGGLTLLANLVDQANTYALDSHIRLLLDRASRRAIDHLARHASQRAAKLDDGSAEEIIAELERGASEIARDGSRPLGQPAGIDALEMIEAAYRGENLGTSVGLNVLDHVTGGIRQEDVWIIGARTSVGKSVLGLCLAKGIAQGDRGAHVFSLEMPRREVQARLIADLTFDPRRVNAPDDHGNVRYSDLLKGRGTHDQRSLARDGARALARLPMVICDQAGLTIDDIRSQALRQARAWERAGVKPGCILIDHIGLVRPVKKTDNKAADTSDLVNELKAVAKAVRAPVIALCQVNRNTEAKDGTHRKPAVSDLNWSGAIEQIADFICLLYREGYYLQRSNDRGAQNLAPEVEHELDLLIRKNRSGPICDLKAFIDVACNAVRDRPEDASPYEAR